MKNIKVSLFFAISILLLLGGIGYVYQTPILVQQDCKSVALYRYHFGVYQIDRDSILGVATYKKVYGWKHFLGLAPILCAEQIEYDQCVVEEKRAALNAEQEKQQWTLVRDNLYINPQRELALKFPYANRCSIFLSEHVLPSKSLSIMGERFYRHLGFGGEDGPSLNDTIDLASFKQLNPSNLYKDKRHVYRYFSMLDGGSFSILEGADASSFELLGDCYAKDKQHIYEERFGKLEDADYASFKTKSDAGCVAQDKNGYWFWNDRKAWKDMNSEEKERAKALQ